MAVGPGHGRAARFARGPCRRRARPARGQGQSTLALPCCFSLSWEAARSFNCPWPPPPPPPTTTMMMMMMMMMRWTMDRSLPTSAGRPFCPRKQMRCLSPSGGRRGMPAHYLFFSAFFPPGTCLSFHHPPPPFSSCWACCFSRNCASSSRRRILRSASLQLASRICSA